MPLVMVGANPRRAPFVPLSRALEDGASRRNLVASLAAHRAVAGALVVATAARAEVYAVVDEGVDGYEVVTALLGTCGPAGAAVAAHGCYGEGIDAAANLFAAVGGADEFSGGDEDVEAALIRAVGEARAASALPPVLSALAEAAGRLGRRLDSLGAEESLEAEAATAAELARRVFDHLERRRVLLVGASPLLEAVAAALGRAGAGQFSTVRPAGGSGDAGVPLDGSPVVAPEALPVVLGNADIVVAAAGSVPEPLDKRLVKSAMRARRGRPLLLLDVSEAPTRAIDDRVASIDDAFLYTAEDLARITRDAPWADLGRAPSRQAAIAEAVRDFAYQLA